MAKRPKRRRADPFDPGPSVHVKRLPNVPWDPARAGTAAAAAGLEPDAYDLLQLERLRREIDGSLAAHRAWLLSVYPRLAKLEAAAERPLPPAWFLKAYPRATPGTVLRPFVPVDRDEAWAARRLERTKKSEAGNGGSDDGKASCR